MTVELTPAEHKVLTILRALSFGDLLVTKKNGTIVSVRESVTYDPKEFEVPRGA